MPKRQLSAKAVLQDIRAGIDDTTLRRKYSLSEKGLESAVKKLVAARLLKEADLRARTPTEEPTLTVWKCPACGKPQTREYDECPECGVIAARFLARQKESRNRENTPASGGKATASTGEAPKDYRAALFLGMLGIVTLIDLGTCAASGFSHRDAQDLIYLNIGFLIAALIALWVFSDATKRGKRDGEAAMWAIGTFLLCIVVLPAWLVLRPKSPLEARVTVVQPPRLCIHCGKYYEGNPKHCPNCQHML